MQENKIIQWALLGVNLVVLATVFYTASALSQQLSDVQGDVAEIKALVQGACCKMEHSTSAPAAAGKPVAAAGTKKAK